MHLSLGYRVRVEIARPPAASSGVLHNALPSFVRHPAACLSGKTARRRRLRTTCSLSEALCDENVEVVCKLNLYPEYDYPPLAIPDHDRDMRLPSAWLSSPTGSVQ